MKQFQKDCCMYLSKLTLRAHLIVASMLVGAALPSIGMAQKLSGSQALPGKMTRPAPPGSRPRATAARSREASGEIDRLRTEMDALHALLKEQTQAISALQKRLDEMQGGAMARVSSVAEGVAEGAPPGSA